LHPLESLNLPSPHSTIWFRLLTIAYGAALFFWLSAEDNSALLVAVFGASGSALLLFGWWTGQMRVRQLSTRQQQLSVVLIGAIWGAGSAVLTTCLMFFKTAWHSHIFPDYPTPMMLAMLERAPIWALVGMLVALAWLLWNDTHA
jgi:hypothetical protein